MNSVFKPWVEVSKRKLLGTLTFVAAMFVVIGASGQLWITHSEPFDLGRAAVGSRLGVEPDKVHLSRFAPFRFSDGDFSGEALFVLCGPQKACFTVVTKKRDARWSVVDLVER